VIDLLRAEIRDEHRLAVTNRSQRTFELSNLAVSGRRCDDLSRTRSNCNPVCAAVLARRLEGANQVFVQLKSQLEADQPRNVVAKTVEQLEGC
jgi:hypothetical protein